MKSLLFIFLPAILGGRSELQSWVTKQLEEVDQQLLQKPSRSTTLLSKTEVVHNLVGLEELDLLTRHFDRLYPDSLSSFSPLSSSNQLLGRALSTIQRSNSTLNSKKDTATSLVSVASKTAKQKSGGHSTDPVANSKEGDDGLEDAVALNIQQATQRAGLLHTLELSKQDSFEFSLKIGNLKKNIFNLINRLVQEKEQILTWILKQKQMALAQITSGIVIIGNIKTAAPRLEALKHDAESKRDSYQKSLDALATDEDKSEAQQKESLKLLLNYYIQQAEQMITTSKASLESNAQESNTTEAWVNKSREELQKWLVDQERTLTKRLREGEGLVLEWQGNITSLQKLYREELQKQLNTRLAIARLDMSTRLSRYTQDLHHQARLQTQIYDTHPGLRPDLSTPDLPSIDSLAYQVSGPSDYSSSSPQYQFSGSDITSSSFPISNPLPFLSNDPSVPLSPLPLSSSGSSSNRMSVNGNGFDGDEITPAALYHPQREEEEETRLNSYLPLSEDYQSGFLSHGGGGDRSPTYPRLPHLPAVPRLPLAFTF